MRHGGFEVLSVGAPRGGGDSSAPSTRKKMHLVGRAIRTRIVRKTASPETSREARTRTVCVRFIGNAENTRERAASMAGDRRTARAPREGSSGDHLAAGDGGRKS